MWCVLLSFFGVFASFGQVPTIQTEPSDATVYEGQETRFTVVATGAAPLTYQWQRDGADLPIEHSATLILVAPELQDSLAKFRCIVSNPSGAQTTREATLTVNPEITPPSVVVMAPAPGVVVRSVTQAEVTFSEPVQGVDAADLTANGVYATEVSGVASGPYTFKFPAGLSGQVMFMFVPNSGIRDLSVNENEFTGAAWVCNVDPNATVPKVRINEINASNENGLVDENGEAVDWIELENFGTTAVNLNGWGLTDSESDPAAWVFPSVTINAGARLIVFASGKDRRPTTGKLHTNFLLSGSGEFLGLYDASSPRELMSGVDFPEQRVDYSYGLTSNGEWKYFKPATPGAPNGTSLIEGIMPQPHFSSERGFYSGPFDVYITTDQPGAQIFYTKNGGDPTGTNGVLYTAPITISSTTVLRAAVVKTNYLPSAPATHTYLYNITAPRRSLPALSIVTATNNLTGPTGIIGIGGGTYGGDGVWQPVRAGDYHNPSKHGLAWERPTSLEYFYPTNNDQFQIDCGIRVQGSDYIRPRYTPSSKFSYRFYFRGDYGSGKLEYPLFDSPVTSFDQLVLRAGHNDDTNPFLKDELMRRMMIDCGQVGSHGVFHTLYLNGVYKGYYNLVERIEKHFCQAWHGSKLDWDVLEQNQVPLDGDNVNFAGMMTFIRNNSMTNPASYLEASRRLDVPGFIDYLLVNIYGANGDWPGNNWRAGRERSTNGVWRFYLWDAEFAFGTFGQPVTHDTFANQLAETSEIPTIYKALRASPEFRLLWADRVNKHYYNGGALVDTNILRNYNTLKAQLTNIISGFNNTIGSTWIPNRRKTVTNLFKTYGLAGAPGAPTFNQFGGRTAAGFQLTMATTATGPNVGIYYTTDGSDPRVMFSDAVSAKAQLYSAPITLDETTVVKARMRTNSAWSALTEATFEVSQFGAPLRFTEINYNPPGGDAYEFVELKNFSAAPINLSGMSFDGIDFRFPEVTMLPAGGIVVIASAASPAAFTQRYPGVVVTGRFANSSLSNGGERIALKDKAGNIVASVDYDDEQGWPTGADGNGYTLELANREIDPNNPAAWRRSKALFGSPGVYDDSLPTGVVLNEVMPANGAAQAWIELHNPGSEVVSLAKFALGDVFNARRFVFPDTATIPAGGYYVQTGFPIGLNGGTIFLFDAKTNQIDAVALGKQLPAYSAARIDGVWTLGTPTSGAENVAASLATPSSVVINEWLANPVSGADDWIELHNTGSAPAALQGMTLSVSNAIYRIPTLTFIPAGGFVQLFATEKTGPDQLGFKLPSAGATIRLYDVSGALVNSVTYGAQAENVSAGRLPDGSETIAAFRGSLSPAASNYVINATSSLVINEVMARNVRSVIDPMGGTADWIELYNSGNALSLDGFSLSADATVAGQWTFPSGVTVPSGGYLTVWFDKMHPASTAAAQTLNTGQSLSAEGGGVYLFNAQGQVVDQVEYGIQAADLTIGRIGSTWTLLTAPTPGGPNALPATLATSETVRINEWTAATDTESAWIELYNSNSVPVSVATMSLTDELNLAGQKKFVLPALSFLGANQFGRWVTSGDKSVASGEINFNISPFGESLRLYSSSLAIADTVSFGMASTEASYSRIPDASGAPVVATPSPLAPNYIALQGIIINEVAPVENRVELRNLTGSAVDLSGWTLSNDPLAPQKVVLPAGTTIHAWGYMAITMPAEAQLDPVFGGTVVLARTLTDGTINGEQARLDYGPAVAGMTYGPTVTFAGEQSYPMSSATIGARNTRATVGPIVISEIMYHPPDDAAAGEYIELFNSSNASVTATGWRINGGVQFNFSDGFSFAPNSTTLLVHFDPSDATARAAFETRYHLAAGATLVGPLRGKLANDGDEIFIERPLPTAANGYIPFVTVDRVHYADQIPWPTAADGTGPALHRIQASEIGNDPLNWTAGAPSPLVFANGEATDRDADGIPDIWEVAHGLDMFDNSDASQDFDADGVSNLAEFLAGTDPFDAKDGFLAELTGTPNAPTLEFNASAGVTYRVEFRDSLSEGAWQLHATFGPFDSGRVVTTPILVDGKSQRFYRIAK